jgi:hypothetical protein
VWWGWFASKARLRRTARACTRSNTIAGGGGAEVWGKQLANGDVALLLLNRGDAPTLNISISMAELPGIVNASAPLRHGCVDEQAGPGRGGRGAVTHGARARRERFAPETRVL